MAVIFIPPGIPYDSSAYVAFGASCNPPPGGAPRWGGFNFDWSLVTPAQPGFSVDFTNFPSMPQQISTLFVDNANSHQAVFIIFPDTGFRLTVKPFHRGYYQVLTKARAFFAGIWDVLAAANDKTFIAALDFFVPPEDGDTRIERFARNAGFNPGANSGGTLYNAASQFARLRGGYAQLSQMTAGGAGFNATLELIADGAAQRVVRVDMGMVAGEFIDGAMLWQDTSDIDVAAQLWQYAWTVNAGALTAPGRCNLFGYFDLCEGL